MKRFLWVIPLVALLLPLQVHAQSVWTAPTRSDGITIEGYKPGFDDAFDNTLGASFPSSAWYLSGAYSVLPSLRLGAEVGLSYYGFDEDITGLSDNEVALNNILFTGEWITPVENLSAILGVRVPTASDNMGIMTGALANLERVNAFNPDVWTFSAEGDYSIPVVESVRLRVTGGPLMMVDTYFDDTETEFLARYAAQAWYDAPRFMVGAGALGITNLTMSDAALAGANRTDLAVGGSLVAKVGRVQPGVTFQVPVTETYRDVVDWVAGVSLRVPF